MPQLVEVHQALGDLIVPLKRDPALEAELVDSDGRPRLRHIRLQWGERDIGTFVITRATSKPAIFEVGGRSLAWWLGDSERGPLIVDRRYCAATNKLSNPGFELGDLDFRLERDTKWVIDQTSPRSGSWGARVVGDPAERDDILGSDEPFEAVAGDAMRAEMYARRASGDTGRLRLRIVYEGRFHHPQILDDAGFEDGGVWDLDSDGVSIVNDPANARTGDSVLKMGPIPQLQVILNGGFEAATLENWREIIGSGNFTTSTDLPRSGSRSLKVENAGGGLIYLQYDSDESSPEVNAVFDPVPGEVWRLRGYGKPDGSPDGNTYLMLGVPYDDNPSPPPDWLVDWHESQRVDDSSFASAGAPSPSDWTAVEIEHTVEEKTEVSEVFVPTIVCDGLTTGRFFWDDIDLTRIKGNRRFAKQGGISVVPGRRFRLRAFCRWESSTQEGSVYLRCRWTATGRDPVVQEAVRMGRPNADEIGQWHALETTVEAPSGYDTLEVAVVGEDIVGGAVYVDDLDLMDDDPSSFVDDVKTAETESSYALVQLDSTVPEGAETMRLEIAAETESDGWRVDDALLRRVCTPVAATAIVSALLTHPDTGNQLVTEGTLHAAGNILFDWHLRSLFAREALDELSSTGLVTPKREWRINSSGELDWGLPAEVFTDRTTFVLTEDDVFLASDPDVEHDAEDFVTDVRVVGAERETARGARKAITGSATNPDLGLTDFFGNPLKRSRLVEDSRINHRDFADALAAEAAAEDASPRDSLELGLHDWKTLGLFDNGDWIYPYLPDDNIEDAANERSWQGRTVFPRRLRVLSRTWKLGAGPFRAFLRRGPSDEIEITDAVLWPKETKASIEVGDPRPEFVTNPQGGSSYRQFLRFRRQTPA